MIVSIIGYRGYIGQNIKVALKKNSNVEILNLIDRDTSHEDMIDCLSKSNVFIHCAAIQKPLINNVSSFLPNLKLTKKIADNLSDSTKLIFISSIHYNSDTPFGIVRKKEENYIKNNVKCYTIYHLPYTFGPFGKPDYNNVFNTYIINIIKNKNIIVNEYINEFALISINNFIKNLVLNLNKCLFIVDEFNTKNLTLLDFLNNLGRIHKGINADSNFSIELKNVYDWYRKQ